MFNDVTSRYDLSDASWEIILMLLGAFILGFVLRHLFCCKNTAASEAENNITNVAAAFAAAGIAEPVAGAAIVRASAPIAEPESLQKVEGIGPKIEGLLWGGGILTMKQLATADLDVVQAILTAAGPRYTMHNPKSWSAQAELIADENWDELKKYQDFLVAGRES